MISIVWKIIIASIILLETMAVAFLGWRVLKLLKRVTQLQADRTELLEERAKQGNLVLFALEKKMILNALSMSQYKNAIDEPQTNYAIRKTYKQLKEKIKASFGG